jgi:hypothetical protein
MLPRIKSIEFVKPYIIRALWTTGELREIDFNSILKPYTSKPESSIGRLLDPEIFVQAKVSPECQTICWDGLIKMRLKDGSTIPAPLDFCPDVLFENSRQID